MKLVKYYDLTKTQEEKMERQIYYIKFFSTLPQGDITYGIKYKARGNPKRMQVVDHETGPVG